MDLNDATATPHTGYDPADLPRVAQDIIQLIGPWIHKSPPTLAQGTAESSGDVKHYEKAQLPIQSCSLDGL